MSKKNVPHSATGVLRFLHDARGNIMPMAAIGMVTMAGLVGGGVDISRGYMVQNRLQNACDSAVLAGRRAVSDDGFDTNAQAQANAYFNTNFDEAGEGTSSTSFTPVSVDGGNQIDGTASTKLSTAVMQLFGFDEMTLSVACSASMSVGNSDIMMVLDTTGSMDWTISGYSTTDDSLRRITFLQDAMKDFYDTVNTATSAGNTRVRYGFVPYSSSVNVGRLLNPAWLRDTVDIQSRRALFTTTTTSTVVGYEPPVITNDSGTTSTYSTNWSNYTGTRYSSESACLNALPSNTDWTDYGSSSSTSNTYINGADQRITEDRVEQGQTRTRYRCRYSRNRGNYRRQERDQYRSTYTETVSTEDPIYNTTTTSEFDDWYYERIDDIDTSNFKLFNPVTVANGTDGANVSYTWEGCIEERSTTAASSFSYSSLLGMTPDVNDLDLDTAPTTNEDTQWAPLWGQLSYRRGTNYYIYNEDAGYDGYKTPYFCPSAAQQFTTMTETEFDAYADALNPEGNTYHDLGMIWGGRLSSPSGMFSTNVTAAPTNGGAVARHLIFMTDGFMQPSYSTHSAYGTEYYDERITDDGITDITDRHTSRFLAVCEAVKAKGIRVWVIAFASALTDDLTACASDDSAFDADSSDSLNNAFQEIAKNVGELRVVQ
ncbi:TadE/TadG family type IV pilus assembly protein [Pontixanthobacter sp. CEM42]|uniref:TadE/TadG family type IV pilus assembly protein n=1 Tax=Pontixanthobacter sp. CEM42 TaxID=2792077 RepID=UPI001ADF8E17|nr:TadE/TadG family type IV pilus assembly protein [Pontixanthobacter sp. CEM42]